MKNLTLFVLLSLLTITSCHEEHEMARPISVDPPVIPPPSASLVYQVTAGEETSVYIYDDSNRIVRTVHENEGHSEVEYLDDLVIQRIYREDGNLDYFTTYELNDEGLFSSRTVSNYAGYIEWREYNAERYLIKNTTVNGGSTLESHHYYSNHNLDSTLYVRDGVLAYTYKYTYLNKVNSLDHEAYGRPHDGKSSKNLIKNWRGYRPDGSIFLQVSFAYTFDQKDRVAKMTQVMNDAITTFEYTYY